MIQTRHLFLLTLLIILSHISLFSQSSWRVKNRIQTALEGDNNTFESMLDSVATSAVSMRVLYQTDIDRSLQNSTFTSQFSTGLQGYNKILNENKWVGNAHARYNHRVFAYLNVGVDGSARWKSFVLRSVQYNKLNINGYIQARLPKQFHFISGVRSHSLRYNKYTVYDYSGMEFYSQLLKLFTRVWRAELRYGINSLDFERPAYVKDQSEMYAHPSAQQHHDAIHSVSARLQHQGRMLWNVTYLVEHNNSNSYGFSYQRIGIIANFSTRILSSYLLRLYAMVENKHYEEILGPDIRDDFDSENKNSNFFIVDISKNLSSVVSLFIRYGWYNNESPYRSQYYRKSTLTIGSEFRF